MMNDKSNGNIYNVCGDTPHEMKYFTDLLVKYSNIEEPIEYKIHEPFWRPIDIHYQNGDSTNLQELTGWKPQINIEQTISDLLHYWTNKIGS